MIKKLALAVLLSTSLSSPALSSDGVLDVAAPFEIKGADPSLSGSIFLKMDIAETLVDAITCRWTVQDVKLAKTNKKARFRGLLSVFPDCIGQSET